MRRPVLLTLAALGAVLGLLSAGLFAALSDTARTGSNQVATHELPGSADLKIATATPSGVSTTCGTFSDDLATALITLDDQTPGFDSGQGYLYCLRNVGSQPVKVSVSAEDFSDVETACTGDEAVYDQTCTAAATGELGDIVSASFFGIDCTTGVQPEAPADVVLLRSTVTTPVSFGTIPSDQTRCYLSSLFMSGATAIQRQAAQSDQLTWRFAFTGVV